MDALSIMPHKVATLLVAMPIAWQWGRNELPHLAVTRCVLQDFSLARKHRTHRTLPSRILVVFGSLVRFPVHFGGNVLRLLHLARSNFCLLG
mmetsp:Transcript_14741/g.36811  ORF Transcript_14741/g.36811 Transcript_14741/m.36811 type:complete len:92 (+) Transcript_14741:1180-1455(+)